MRPTRAPPHPTPPHPRDKLYRDLNDVPASPCERPAKAPITGWFPFPSTGGGPQYQGLGFLPEQGYGESNSTSPWPYPASSSSRGGLDFSATAWIFAVIIVAVIVLLLVWWFWTNNETSCTRSGLGEGATRIPIDQVGVHELIGRGGQGQVYRGTYKHRAVAVKKFWKCDPRNVAEAELMARFSHPNIVRFVGVAEKSRADLWVLSELMERGDLQTWLKELNSRGHPQGFNYAKIRIACGIAQGLEYLHSLTPVVIHRDLKSNNVLLTEGLEPKLTDFGLSRECPERTVSTDDCAMTVGVGTVLWMAPEVSKVGGSYNEKVDIFSFGVLLSELDSQLLPYAKLMANMKANCSTIAQAVASGALQAPFSSCSSCCPMPQLGKEYLALDPSARPSASVVVARLKRIMDARDQQHGYV